MKRDLISGMERLFDGEIPEPGAILVKGMAGSLKSALCFNLMSRALRADQFGIYLTLEQDRESHLVNMRSLDMDLPGGLMISDYTHMRKETDSEDAGEIDLIDSIIALLCRFKKEKGEQFSLFTLDSINALYALVNDENNLRLKMFQFLSRLRELGITTFLIKETLPDLFEESKGAESFLADGVIHLGLLSSQQDIIRYIQVIKMRGARHSLKKFQIEPGERGLKILGPVYV